MELSGAYTSMIRDHGTPSLKSRCHFGADDVSRVETCIAAGVMFEDDSSLVGTFIRPDSLKW